MRHQLCGRCLVFIPSRRRGGNRRLWTRCPKFVNSHIMKKQMTKVICFFGDPAENRTPDEPHARSRTTCSHRMSVPSRRQGGNRRLWTWCPKFVNSRIMKKQMTKVICFFGDPAENRTPDTMIKSHVLCQLSYWVMGVLFSDLFILSVRGRFVKQKEEKNENFNFFKGILQIMVY